MLLSVTHLQVISRVDSTPTGGCVDSQITEAHIVIELSLITSLGSTGALTDYFDTENINYICVTGFDLSQTKSFVVGSVRTIECEDGPFEDENISTGLGYLDVIDPGDILLVRGSQEWAYFGELMSTISQQRNLAAAVILGKTRDSRFTQDFFPIWSNGYTPIDIKGRGRVKSVGGPVLVDGHKVTEGMICAADNDGILFFDKFYIRRKSSIKSNH